MSSPTVVVFIPAITVSTKPIPTVKERHTTFRNCNPLHFHPHPKETKPCSIHELCSISLPSQVILQEANTHHLNKTISPPTLPHFKSVACVAEQVHVVAHG